MRGVTAVNALNKKLFKPQQRVADLHSRSMNTISRSIKYEVQQPDMDIELVQDQGRALSIEPSNCP